jgi:hypothetical protein
VLVVVNDERTCYQLRQVLVEGGRGLLEQQFRRFLSHKYPQFQLGVGMAEVGGARKRKQSAPRKAFHPSTLEGAREEEEEEEREAPSAVCEGLAQTELQFSDDGGCCRGHWWCCMLWRALSSSHTSCTGSCVTFDPATWSCMTLTSAQSGS